VQRPTLARIRVIQGGRPAIRVKRDVEDILNSMLNHEYLNGKEQAWKIWAQLQERLPHGILIQTGRAFLGEFEFAQAVRQSLLC